MTLLESPPTHANAPEMSAAEAGLPGGAFRQAMREFASGVAIVTCGEGDRRAGCTATALSSLSLAPPAIIVCLDRAASTLPRLRETGAFAVNLLAGRHEALAARFAGRGGFKGASRFDDGDWISLVSGSPVLADALAAIDCHVEEILDRHSHAIIIGAVRGVRLDGATRALVHWRSRFETLG
jgi:flavin reductase (DIM6/NTAB) family NADH-FMN oxidoreductase RutF